MKRKPKPWHFCKKHPEKPCPYPCNACWRTLDREKLPEREDMVK